METTSFPTDLSVVHVSVPLSGDDSEIAVIGAILHLLDRTYYQPGMQPLEPIQKDRIARYLFNRYKVE